jgi:hypothetical protein
MAAVPADETGPRADVSNPGARTGRGMCTVFSVAGGVADRVSTTATVATPMAATVAAATGSESVAPQKQRENCRKRNS